VAVSSCATVNGDCNNYYFYTGSTPTGTTLITDPIGTGANQIYNTNCNQSNFGCLPYILPDHTTGSGYSLYVDPSDVQGRAYWSQTINISQYTNYEFSAWLMVIEEDPNLIFRVNGVNLSEPFNLDRQTGGSNGSDTWQKFKVQWYSGTVSGPITIELVNYTAGCFGNDIRIDDISFRSRSISCDADQDGISNALDIDSDNDGIYDLVEAGHAASDINNDGIIDGNSSSFGTNGLSNSVETSPNSGSLNYTLKDSESVGDGVLDAYEIDADGDSCFDTEEAIISDNDNDGIAGIGTPSVNIKGKVNGSTYANPAGTNWQNSSIKPCVIPEICNNGIDDDGDGLIDCMDCEDCTSSSS